mgnify:CR=1 FL=1
MFCTKCGRELSDAETYCPYCGQIFSHLDGTPYEIPDDTVKDQMAGNVLTWGILSLAFAVSGCLSLLGGPRKTKRYRKIKVQYQNLALQTRVKTFTGWTAQIIQHEVDHCNGVLI